MQVIDPNREMVVNQATFEEVLGAVEVDLYNNIVKIKKRGYPKNTTEDNYYFEQRHFPAGLKLMRRY